MLSPARGSPSCLISVLLAYAHSWCSTVVFSRFLYAFLSVLPQVPPHFPWVCLGPAIAHGWRVSAPSGSILVLLGPSTAGLAVSGVPGLSILATGTVFGTRAPARALSLTPWIAIVGVGALPKSDR